MNRKEILIEEMQSISSINRRLVMDFNWYDTEQGGDYWIEVAKNLDLVYQDRGIRLRNLLNDKWPTWKEGL